MSVACDEGAPDLAAERCPDRDVLQVGVAAAQPAGRRDRLVERGVHATRVRPDQSGQGVDIRALQLLDRPPFHDQTWQRMVRRQLLEYVRRGGWGAGLPGLLPCGQRQLVEENGRQLSRRVDVERFAREAEDLRLQLAQLGVHPSRLVGEGGRWRPGHRCVRCRPAPESAAAPARGRAGPDAARRGAPSADRPPATAGLPAHRHRPTPPPAAHGRSQAPLRLCPAPSLRSVPGSRCARAPRTRGSASSTWRPGLRR